MKTKFGTKLLSLLLCVCMLIPMFTACGNKDKDDDNKPLSWEATAEQVIPLEMEIQNGESNTTLVLSYGEDIFSSIENEQIKLTIYQKAISNDETAESAESSIAERTPTDFTASVTNAKQLTITVPRAENDWGYLVSVHSSAISSGKFGEAYGFNHEVIEEYISYSATISGEYATGDVNPVITVTLENTACADSLLGSMFVLDGAFKDLTITGVAGNGYNITITTEGKINDLNSQGIVTLKVEATNCGEELVAVASVLPIGAAVIVESYQISGGSFTFKVELGNMTFTADKAALASAITADSMDIDVKELGENYAVFSIATDAADVDAALDLYGGKRFTIAESVLSSGDDIELFICATEAELNFVVDYITTEGEIYRAEALLYTFYGTMGDISKFDLVFGGAFEGATVESVEKNKNCYDVVFTFTAPYNNFNHEECDLDGTLTVTAGKIVNDWGTNADNTCSFNYVYNDDMNRGIGETIDAIAEFVEDHKDAIGTITSTVSGVAGTISGVKTVLEVVGVVESTNSKIDALKNAIAEVSNQVNELSNKMSNIHLSISNSIAEISDKIDKSAYIMVEKSWREYKDEYIGNLKTIMSEYKEKYRVNMVKFLNDPANTQIKIYVDSDGNVTLPSITENRSPDGKKIVKIYTCKGNEELVKQLADQMIEENTLAINGRTLMGDYDKSIESAFSKYDLLIDVETGEPISKTTLTATQQYNALVAFFAKSALDQVGADKVLNAYTAFCYRLDGGADASANAMITGKTYLDDYYTMISLYYNFYSEAENDIILTKTYLKAIRASAYDLALFAQEYYTTQADTVSKATTAFETALEKKAPGEDADMKRNPSFISSIDVYGDVSGDVRLYNKQYSYVLNSRVGIIGDPSEDTLLQFTKLNAEQVKLIYNRYVALRNAGFVPYTDFYKYLRQDQSLELGDASIVISHETTPFKPDGSVWLYATAEASGSSYFENGKINKIDTSGSREAECYDNLKLTKITRISLDGKINIIDYYACGTYYEDHFYWRYEEDWSFERYLTTPAYIGFLLY